MPEGGPSAREIVGGGVLDENEGPRVWPVEDAGSGVTPAFGVVCGDCAIRGLLVEGFNGEEMCTVGVGSETACAI